jgi:transposase
MQSDTALLQYHSKLLNLPTPWQVTGVEVDVPSREVRIQVEYPMGHLAHCPECNQLRAVHDHREKKWRHLAQGSFRSILICKIPRIDCEHHGIRQILVPWAEPNSRFSLEFESFAVAILQAVPTIKQAAELLGISWDAAQAIQHRAVWRGKEREKPKPLETLGIDEKSFLSRHRYATVLSDIKEGRVLEVVRERTEDAAKQALSSLTEEQRQGVKAIAMDFLQAYSNAAEELLPKALRIHDKFHVAGYLTKAVDKVRRTEHWHLMAKGNKSLKGTRFLWLTNMGNWDKKQKEMYASLRVDALKVGRAFSMKEQFRCIWTARSKKEAMTFFNWWYNWATHSRLKPMVEVAKTIKRHINSIMNYFRFRITNATAEGLNSKIQIIKSEARGFRNFDNFRIAILFHCGGLNLSPHNSP